MRGLLIINPQATTTSGDAADQVAKRLAGLVDLEVAYTRYRGHARELAAVADCDLLIVFGGDGAVNEVVNGLMDRPGAASPVPALVTIPGGGGNVFARALGLPAAPQAALTKIADLLAAGSYRSIGLSRAGQRYFTFSAGLGMDAEVVREVERQRARGRKESQTLFMRTVVRRYYRGTDRRTPALTLDRDGAAPVTGLFMVLVTNSAPWTYVRGRPLLPRPDPDFSSGLDVLGLDRLHFSDILGAMHQMFRASGRNRPPSGKHVVTAHRLDSVTIRCSRPTAFHVDGEYLGQTEEVEFTFVPDALRVVAPPTADLVIAGRRVILVNDDFG